MSPCKNIVRRIISNLYYIKQVKKPDIIISAYEVLKLTRSSNPSVKFRMDLFYPYPTRTPAGVLYFLPTSYIIIKDEVGVTLTSSLFRRFAPYKSPSSSIIYPSYVGVGMFFLP